ncbi:YeiH family protein [Rhodococcus sp. NPDC058639]|uniref:YeiH family protein n=1 Tax=Rhodococcus sp. NPDC058639 TaxID=3346570 RepID=UPI00364F283A
MSPLRPEPLLRRMRPALPGLLAGAAGAAVALAAAGLFPGASPLLIAIVLGVVVTNVGPRLAVLEPGLTLASKHLLRIGVALLGLQLSISDVVGLGWGAMGVAAAVVTAGIGGALLFGKWLGVGWTERMLIACGFSICGAAAAAAVDGVIDTRKRELVTTVALVVVFGTAMIPLVPALSGALGLDSTEAGMWAGAAVHEVAQVVAAGTALDATAAGAGGALAVAVTVKLARVALLAPVVAAIGAVARRSGNARRDGHTPPLVPAFLVAFLVLVAVRATGVIGPQALDVAHWVQVALLTIAMFALGTDVRRDIIRGLGWRPLALATAATVWVAAIALAGVLVIA